MLRLALLFELRTLLRSRAGAIALVAYLLSGGVALLVGAGHIADWEQGIGLAREAQEASVAEARALFEAGESGPADRSWVDLSKARWQSDYAATRVVRAPAPLAGIAAGSVDPAPVAFHLQPWADPLAAAGARIENPELARGSIDLIFVLVVLTPLLIGILGFDIGGREREERIDRLVVVQAGSVRRWLLARVMAVTAIVSGAVAALCIAAGAIGGASLFESVALLGFAGAYSALWGGLLLLVNATARTARAGAFGFGALWIVATVLVPAVVAEVGIAGVQADFALGDSLEARAEQWSAYDLEEEERLALLYARFPELQELPGATDGALDPSLKRHSYKGPQLTRLLERHHLRAAEARAAQQLAEDASWVSPPVALTLALERLAGAGPDAAMAYRAYLISALEDRLRWIVVRSWKMEPLERDAFEGLVGDAPAPYVWQPSSLWVSIIQLFAWVILAWVVGLLRLLRAD